MASTCGSPAEFRGGLLTELRSRVGCDGALLRPGAHWAGSNTQYLDEGPRFTDIYVRHRERYKPDLAHWCTLSSGSAPFVDTLIYPTREQGRMAVYSEAIRPAGICSILAMPLAHRGQSVGLVFLFRRGRARPFSDDDVAALAPVARGFGFAEWAVTQSFRSHEHAPRAAIIAPSQPPEIERFRNAFEGLAPRERRVALMISDGLQSKEIASLLGTSFHTVRAQTLRVYHKLGVQSRTHLARLVHVAATAGRLSGSG